MKVKLAKWGNSLAVRIPSPLAAEASLEVGRLFDVKYTDGSLSLTPVEAQPTLVELLGQMTEENRHDEVALGEPVGKEIW